MKTTRLEAFSDGVLAIIITIMVLELKVPHAVELAALKPLLPVLLSYVLSFIYSAFTGTITIIFSKPRNRSAAEFFGQTCICCFGCRSFLLPRVGWVRTG